MTNVERLRLPTPDEALKFKRASSTSSVHRLIESGGHSLKLLPSALVQAFECEAWLDRVTPNGAPICNGSFIEWVTEGYPVGLGATLEVIESILTSATDQADAQHARLLWDRAVRRQDGGNNNPHGRAGKPDGETTVDNINGDKRPTGTSAAAGLRRLDREAEAGNSHAAQALEAVKAGAKSVHRAMVDCGFRKALDPEVKAVAARDAAEAIVSMSEGDFERLSAVEHLLRKAGAKNVADQIANLVDPAIMDRRHG